MRFGQRIDGAVEGGVDERKPLGFGGTLWLAGRDDLFIERSHRTPYLLPGEEVVRAAPDDASKLCFLGLINASVSRKEEALREGRRAIELLPAAKDALNGTEVLYFYAVICAWTEERNQAIEQLETLAKLPAGISYGEIRLDPFWDPLRGDPRFEQIVVSLAPK